MAERRSSETFVARIWLERQSNGTAMWRGRIQHIQSGREGYFQDLGQMRAFLERATGVPGPAAERMAETDVTVPEPGSAAKTKPND